MGNKHSRRRRQSETNSTPPPVPQVVDELKSTKTLDVSATKIQSVWKGYRVRSQRDDLSNWKLFNELENREEADVLQLSQFLRALRIYMPYDETNQEEEDTTDETVLAKQLSNQSVGKIDISNLYEGVRLHDPLTLEDVMELVESFKRGQLLHEQYVRQLLKASIAHLQNLPNVSHVTISPSPHITIIGDLHGQLDDLLLIFRENGFPSKANPYVFNGDFVDRGTHSIEVALLIYAFQIVCPESVYINRGNHEDRSVSTVFGFMKECQEKYNTFVYDMFVESFQWLPLCTVIDKRIIVLHGGLTRSNVSVQDMELLPRWEYELARKRTKPKSNIEKLHEEQMNVLRDIFWSDPHNRKGSRDNKRGAGILFGPDVAETFLVENKLQLLVRSHECVPKGFQWPFGARGMVVTLFSASNYCGKANNLGAFMRIPSSTSKNPAFYQYMASSGERDMLAHNLEGMFSLILEHQHELLTAFKARDLNNKGVVSYGQWTDVMEHVLHIHMQWRIIQPLLTSMTKEGFIPYIEFLDRYNVDTNVKSPSINTPETQRELRRDLFNRLYKHRAKLEALFRVFDKNGDGRISRKEFEEGITLLNAHLPEGMRQFENADELMKLLDFGHDNAININEFMEGFRIDAHLTVQAKWRRARQKLKALRAFGKLTIPGTTRSSFSTSDVAASS